MQQQRRQRQQQLGHSYRLGTQQAPPHQPFQPTSSRHAPDIRLDAPIHETLQANFRGSLCMTRLVARMAKLRSFVYVSTCYVNINKAPMSQVEERWVASCLGLG